MIRNRLNDASTEGDLIAQSREEGRKEQALRMTRLALSRRFGGLEQPVSLALEQLDRSALETLIVDQTLALEEVRERAGRSQKPAPSVSTEDQHSRLPQRLSPLGGYRRS